jgi:hypothetical protein
MNSGVDPFFPRANGIGVHAMLLRGVTAWASFVQR